MHFVVDILVQCGTMESRGQGIGPDRNTQAKGNGIMKRTINGKKVRITESGYLYVDGKRVTDRKMTPFYHAYDIVEQEIGDFVHEWTSKNFRMV